MFKVMEYSSKKVFTVLDVQIIDGKTRFLVWNGYWRWIDARKTEFVEDGSIGG